MFNLDTTNNGSNEFALTRNRLNFFYISGFTVDRILSGRLARSPLRSAQVGFRPAPLSFPLSSHALMCTIWSKTTQKIRSSSVAAVIP